MRFKYGLSSLIIIIMFAVASGSLLLGYFLNVLTLRQTLEAREANRARDIYNWINADIRHNIHNIIAVTQILKSDTNVSNGLVKYEVDGKIEPLQDTINKLQRILSPTNVDFLLVTDMQGYIVYQSSENKFDGPNAVWIWGMDEALAGKENLSASLSPFGWTITTLTPLLKGSNQYGVLILGITLDDKFARNIAQATNTQISFCNPYHILASSWPTKKPKQVDLSRVANSIEKKQQLFFFDPQSKYSSFYLPIKIVDETACLVINTDTTPIFKLLLKKREQLFLSFLVVLIIMLALGTGLTYIMVRPLRKLQRRADDVIKNYSSEEVPMNRVGNEIDTLSQAMELMLATIQKHMEKLLQAQEEWERTFNTIPALIMILDNQHRIVKANQAMAQAFGYNPEGMVDKFCHQVVHGSEIPPAFCPHSRLLSHGYAEPQEIWLEEIQSYLHLSVTPLYDRSGRLLGCVHVANDITERKIAEKALRESEEKYRLLVGQIPSVVFKGYEDWGVDCFDDKIEALTGYSKEDFNSRRIIWRNLIPEEELPHLKQVFREALRGDRFLMREHRIKKKDGSYAWVQSRSKIFCNEQGEVEYISGVVFDITARKQTEAALRESEERYRLIAENVGDVLWTTDMDLRLTYISPSIQHMVGFAPEEIVGKNAGELLLPASMAQALEVLSEELAREKLESTDPNRSRVLELDGVHKNKSLIRTEVKVSFIRDSDHQPIGVLGVTRDITKRKQVEESLHRRDAFLEAVSLAAERFLRTDFWEANPTDILGQLGQAMKVSRVYIFQNHLGEDNTLLTSMRFEWVALGIASEMNNPNCQNFPIYTGGMSRFADFMARGEVVHGQIKDFTAEEQAILVPQGVKSIICVPIFVEDYWWGCIGFDECLEEREWAIVEIEALKTAANMLGAAILQSRSEKALRESEKRLRSLSYQLLDVQENERKRLALELHDVLGHDLLNLKLKIESFMDELLPEHDHFRGEGAKIVYALQDSLKHVRLLYQDLIPADLEEQGLTAALENLLEEFALARGITWEARLDRTIDNLFDLPLQTNIYRLVQEGLTNIGKHAKATHIFLGAEKDKEKLTLILEDNGIGFNVSEVRAQKRTMGLLSMEKRLETWGGSFGIQSRPKQGTRICATVPISKRK